MNDSYNQIRRRRKFHVWAFVLLLLSIVIALVPAYAIYAHAAEATGKNYDVRLFGYHYDPATFTIKCFIDSRCPTNVRKYLLTTPLLSLNWWFYLSSFVFSLSLVFLIISRTIRAERDPGVAHWATLDELRDSGYTSGVGYLGVAHGEEMRYPRDTIYTTTLVLGNPGSGKTRSILEPMSLRALLDGHSIIVFDQKHPNADGFPKYFPWIEEYTGAKIEVLLPNDPNTPTLPLFQTVKTREDALQLAYVFYPHVDPGNILAHHFNRERPILKVVLYLEAVYGVGNFKNVLRVFSRGFGYFRDYINQARASGQLNEDDLGSLQAFFDLSGSERSKSISSIVGRLEAFHDDNIARALSFSGDTIDISQFGKRQTVLYIGLDQDSVSKGPGQAALSVLKSSIDYSLRLIAKEHGGKLPVPVLVFMDEAPAMGYVPGLVTELNTMRERRVGYVFAAQNIAAYEEQYGGEHSKEVDAIIESCGHIVLTHKTSPKDVFRVTRYVGKTSNEKKSHTNMHEVLPQPFEGRRSIRREIEGDDLIRPDEFRKLRLGQAVVISQEVYPFIADFPLLDSFTVPKAKRLPATERWFNQIRQAMPKPPRGIETLRLMLAPYLPVVTAKSSPRTRVGGEEFAAEAPAPPPSLANSAAVTAPRPPMPTQAKEPTKSPGAEPLEPAGPAAASSSLNAAGVDPESAANLKESLNDWVKGLSREPVRCELRIGGSLEPEAARLSKLLKKPFPIPPEEVVANISAAGLITSHPGGRIEITKAGYKALDSEARKTLSRLSSITALIDWVEENGKRVIGHPKYVENDTEEPKGQITGDGYLIIARTHLANEVLRGASPTPEYLELLLINPDEDARLRTNKSRRRAWRIPLPRGLYAPSSKAGGEEVQDEAV